MEKTRNEGRHGRLSHLLRGRARSRRNPAPMVALILIAVLSFAGAVSADDFWKGDPPNTANGTYGSVTGGVDVIFADTWKTQNNIDYDDAWANVTLEIDPSPGTLQFAHAFVTMYSGNMTDYWPGNFSLTIDDGDSSMVYYPVRHFPLNLYYDNTTGIIFNSSLPYLSLKSLTRVTSDYVAKFDLTNTIKYCGDDINFHVETWNESLRLQNGLGRFDGRIKEVLLVYGWDQSGGSTTNYWINVGQDPMTKNIGTYTGNKTWFYGVPTSGTSNLWVNYLASSTGKGSYTWNEVELTDPDANTQGVYAGLSKWEDVALDASGNDVLTYARTNNWYKNIISVLTVL